MAASMPRKRIRIGDLLVEQKIISQSQLQEALTEQKKSGRKLGRVLIENGFIDEDRLLVLLSEQLDIPYVDLSRFELDPELVACLPETRQALPCSRIEGDAHRTVGWNGRPNRYLCFR